MAREPPPEGFTFTYSSSVAHFNVPSKAFLSTRPLIRGANTGALVFSRATVGPGETVTTNSKNQQNAPDRILLIQRAPHDSMPLRWEVPGGACDPEDPTMLHGLARELWEEVGLKLRRVVRQVGNEDVFLTRRGLAVAKVTFEVEVETPPPCVPSAPGDGEGNTTQEVLQERLPEVSLDPNEHVRFVWATEEECRQGKAVVLGASGEREEVNIEFTTKHQRQVVLLGFELRKQPNNEQIST
jgi:8-oxo-dGTP pyrophosphatase MutT (NUDIX family)